MLLRTFGGLALTESSIKRPKPLLLLTYLSIEGPQERRFLAELFWMGAANPRQSLSVALGQLRAGASGAVASDGALLRSLVDCDAPALLDATNSGRWAEARDLYRGPFLAGIDVDGCGVELEEWIYGTREALASSAQQAFVAAAEAAAAGGDRSEATRLAERAFALSSGGADPDADVVGRLHALLVNGRSPRARELADEARTIGLEVHGATTPAPTDRSPEPTSHHTPTPLTSFVGRQDERREVARLLAGEARLVTLVGLGGAGKTRLSLELMRELVDDGSVDRARFVALETVHDATEVPSRILEALRRTPSVAATWDTLVADLRRDRALVVLDNVEQVDGCAGVVMELLEACPTVRVLVTSREPLNVAAEYLVPVEGLGTPESATDALARHPSVDAVDLFVERARRVQPRFELDAENAEAVVRICRLLAGLPLGIELAASLMRTLTPDDMASALEADLDVLMGRGPDRPDRHTSLRAAFDRTWHRLTPSQRAALERVSVFEGGFTRRAAADAVDVTVPMLASLVDASLVRRQERRFEVHPLVQQYARERLASSPDVEHETRARHAAYWTDFAEARNPETRRHGHRTAFSEVVADMGNVGAAWRWAATTNRLDLLDRMLPSLSRVLADTGRQPELSRLLDDALTHVPSGTATHARLVTDKYWVQPPNAPGAHACALRALELTQKVGSEFDVARARHMLAVTTVAHGDAATARTLLGQALESFRRLEQSTWLVGCLNDLALVTDEAPEQRGLLEEAIETSRALGDTVTVARALANLGVLEDMTYGDYRAELELLEQALAEERAANARSVFLASLEARRGIALLRAGDADAAEYGVREAEALLVGTEHLEVGGVRETLRAVRALLHHQRGDANAARAEAAGCRDHPLCLELLVRLALDDRDLDHAERCLDTMARSTERLVGSRDRLLHRAKVELFRAELAAARGGSVAAHILAALDIVTRFCFVPTALAAFVTTAVTVPTKRKAALLRVAATHPAATTITRSWVRSITDEPWSTDDRPLDTEAVLQLARDLASELTSHASAATRTEAPGTTPSYDPAGR